LVSQRAGPGLAFLTAAAALPLPPAAAPGPPIAALRIYDDSLMKSLVTSAADFV